MTIKAIWWLGCRFQRLLIGWMKLGYPSCNSQPKKYRGPWDLKATQAG